MKRFYYFTIILLLLSGCQSAMSVFDKSNTQYERGLQHTKVKSIIYKDETKAIINITYLNSMDNDNWDDKFQNFLVGIYISQDNEIENTKFLHNNRYILTMNGEKYIKSNPDIKRYRFFKNIPLKNPWARYYIVSFEDIKEKNILTLKYTNPIFGTATIEFEK
jgi:uncharacterized protein YceK